MLEDLIKALHGHYVVIRDHRAGVYAGTLCSMEGSSWVLKDARQAHYWTGAAATPGLAHRGPGNREGERIGPVVPHTFGFDIVSMIPCTEDAKLKWENSPVWEP